MKEIRAYLPIIMVALVGLLAIAGIQQQGNNEATGLVIGKYDMESLARPPSLSLRPKCTETDRGYDWYIAGTTVYESASYRPKQDACKGPYTLHEYYCHNNRRTSRTVTCPLGYSCKNSACEPDNGVYYVTKSSVLQQRAENAAKNNGQ